MQTHNITKKKQEKYANLLTNSQKRLNPTQNSRNLARINDMCFNNKPNHNSKILRSYSH